MRPSKHALTPEFIALVCNGGRFYFVTVTLNPLVATGSPDIALALSKPSASSFLGKDRRIQRVITGVSKPSEVTKVNTTQRRMHARHTSIATQRKAATAVRVTTGGIVAPMDQAKMGAASIPVPARRLAAKPPAVIEQLECAQDAKPQAAQQQRNEAIAALARERERIDTLEKLVLQLQAELQATRGTAGAGS